MRNIEIMCKQHACRTGKSSAEGKGHYFIFGSVYAHGIGCNFVFTDSQAAAAVRRIFKVFNKENDKNHNPENPGECC
mgnify:CR=1 FL=1